MRTTSFVSGGTIVVQVPPYRVTRCRLRWTKTRRVLMGKLMETRIECAQKVEWNGLESVNGWMNRMDDYGSDSLLRMMCMCRSGESGV